MKMKFNLLALGLSLGLASATQANLILTSDSPLHPPDESPAALEAFVGAELGNPNLIDAIQVQGSGGNLDIGELQVVFNSDQTATISYDLTGRPFTAAAFFVFGPDGGNLYAATADQFVVGGGTVQAPFTGSGNQIAGISHIDFFIQTGSNSVPESGATVMFFGAALGGLALVRRFGMC